MFSKSNCNVAGLTEFCNLFPGSEGQDNFVEAIATYQVALDSGCSSANIFFNLGCLLQDRGQVDEAIASYQSAIDAGYSSTDIYFDLGCLFQDKGQIDKAIASYRSSLVCDPQNHRAKLNLVMAQLPIIYRDQDEIEFKRSSYQDHLLELANYYRCTSEAERSAAADLVGATQPFYLAYQGLCDRDLQQTYGSLLHLLMSSRYPKWCQPLSIKTLKEKRKIRLGFVSGFFNAHSVWKIPLQGWLDNLDRSEFELFGYFTGSRSDNITKKAAKAFDRFEYNCVSVEEWAEKIVEDNLDVLVFPEFGMDSMTVRIGCLRLAPLQVAFGGHPETSGLPTIDYHLSSDLMEPAQAQSHYTEKLVRLPNLAVCYQHLPIKPKLVTKEEIGLQLSLIHI